MAPSISHYQRRKVEVFVHCRVMCSIDTKQRFAVLREHSALPIRLDHEEEEIRREVGASRNGIRLRLEAQQVSLAAELFHPSYGRFSVVWIEPNRLSFDLFLDPSYVAELNEFSACRHRFGIEILLEQMVVVIYPPMKQFELREEFQHDGYR